MQYFYFNKYDDWFVKNENIYKSELMAVKSLIPKNEKGVEFGVGSARFSLPLGLKFGTYPSPKIVEISRRKEIKVFEALAENLPFENKDLIIVRQITNYSIHFTDIAF